SISDAYLIMGIGKSAGNTPPAGVTALTTDQYGFIITNFQGQSFPISFIDSGSNIVNFAVPWTPAIATCSLSGETFFCPSPSAILPATLFPSDGSGSGINVNFEIYNASTLLNTSNNMFSNIASPGALVGTGDLSYFDWGLPFFFGKTIY